MANAQTLGATADTSIPSRVSPAPTPSGTVSGVSRRTVLALCAPMFLMLIPLADHQSKDPILLTYSWHYIFFLAGLIVLGFAAACALAWIVRRAPARRQVSFGLILLAMPLGAFLACELYLGHKGRDAFAEYRKWGHGHSPLMGYEALPNHRWEMVGATYTTDEKRLRTHVASRPAREDETLIVVLGGSSAFGYGLNDDETWSHLVEQKLRSKFGDSITVLNAATNGHNTLQQLIRMYLRVLPHKPDVVVYYGGINDVRADGNADRLIALPGGLPEAFSVREYLRQVNKGKGFYFENSLVLDRVSRALSKKYLKWKHAGRWPGPRVYTEDDYSITVDMYIRNFHAIDVLCRDGGTEFVPVSFIFDPEIRSSLLRTGMDFFVRRLREHCRGNGLPLIDLYPAFERLEDQGSLFFDDRYHPNHAGAEFIATHVADELAPIVAAHLDRSTSIWGEARERYSRDGGRRGPRANPRGASGRACPGGCRVVCSLTCRTVAHVVDREATCPGGVSGQSIPAPIR